MNAPGFGRNLRYKYLRSGLILLIVVVAFVVRTLQSPEENAPADKIAFDERETHFVQRVVDGDTFRLKSGQRVRLLGINTPELARDGRPAEPLAEEATIWLRNQIEGREIQLTFDKEREDDYGRILAYVWTDNRLINEELIREGFTKARTDYAFSSTMKRRFREVEKEARTANKGIWK